MYYNQFIIFFSFLIFLFSCKSDDSEEIIEKDIPLYLTEWAPIGAKWYYSDSSPGHSPEDGNGYLVIESVRDTLLNNIDARVLEIHYFFLGELQYKKIEVMYGDMEKVYHWDKHEEEFYKLYDFSANSDDTLEIRPESFINYFGEEINYFVSVIDSTFYRDFNGLSLKVLIAKPVIYEDNLESVWMYAEGGADATIIQGIGSAFWMFGGQQFSLQSEKSHIGLRCFEYNGSVYKYNNYPLDCDYMSLETK